MKDKFNVVYDPMSQKSKVDFVVLQFDLYVL
jgi:hypothetical protein